MKEFEVTCIINNDRGRIVEIGGPAGGGWKLSAAEVIARVKQVPQEEAFYTNVKGKKAYIGVDGQPPNEYLRTHADGYWDNNLDALPACPVVYKKIA